MSELSFADVALPVARGFVEKRRLLKDRRMSEPQMARVRESLSDDLKKLSDVVTPELFRPRVSVAARARAKALVVPVDLCRETWHRQPTFDPGREIFHREHIVPIRHLREMCIEAADARDIVAILEVDLRVAWVLKEEDEELTACKFRTHRPDPKAAYSEAKIKLRDCHRR